MLEFGVLLGWEPCLYDQFTEEEITKIVLPLRLVEENGKLTVRHTEDEQILTQNRLYKAFVPCVVFLVMELISFFAGFSLFVKAQQQLSLFCHIVGILLLYGFIYHAYVKSFLLLVVLSPAVLPFISELVIIIKHYFIMF
ncbi:uncharacterized protein [Parasteatoda tepidariorum]|uniref:uncharacterized protein isoform X1 n=1 Tax=Parasteatoda tepidariorum TaxID=114398 RepID=UPI001C7236E6|nr:uncharacterized protein LOC107446670 isoform X2 [Parasteatoda tepidariorum]